MAEKILIVDDDVDSLKLIGLMLKRHGYEVVVADTGGKALSKAEAELPNLIILDVMMPDMNGLEVCRRLRANPQTVNIPIIMFTAKTLIDDKVKGFEAGADDYLTKPTHPAELATRVKSILSRNQAKQDTPATNPPKAQQQRGMAIGVLGTKGGVGTSTVAVNVAAALVQAGEKPVLADFRLGQGNIGLMLGANAQGMARTINAPSIDLASMEAELISHTSGLRALTCSIAPREAQLNLPVDRAVEISRALRALGNPAIIDIGSGITALNVRVAAEVDKLLYVVESTPIALAMASLQLKELENEIGGGRISVVVVNRSQTALPWHEVENALGREVKALISPAPELAYQALVNKTPMVLMQPTAMVSGQFIKLAEDVKTRLRTMVNRPANP